MLKKRLLLPLHFKKLKMDFLKELGVSDKNAGVSTGKNWIKSIGETIQSYSPVDGKQIGSVIAADKESYEMVVACAQSAFKEWRTWPAPKRGEIVRQVGVALREKKEALGKLVSYEMGKSLQEGLGEVQEMIDICDFAVGLSRQLHGLPCIANGRATGCMSSIILWALLELFQLLISPWQFGAGTRCLHGFVVMFVFGSLLKKRPYVR
jgi:acyl-CoA reductase-like NAD-dependent aldehyde dehydrogenase